MQAEKLLVQIEKEHDPKRPGDTEKLLKQLLRTCKGLELAQADTARLVKVGYNPAKSLEQQT